MFACAKAYYEENGNLEVPRRYKTADGYSLGNWTFTMRKIRAGEQYGNLDEKRIAKLDSIGMVWSGARDAAWERNFAVAKEYAEENGDLNVKASYVTAKGIRLGSWISNLRTCRKSGIQTSYLTTERIAAFDKLGMIWAQPDFLFERNYAAALAYYKAHSNLEVPSDCVVNGVKLGMWLNTLRVAYKRNGGVNLTEEQTARLNELGMRWGNKADLLWEQGFAEAKQYALQKQNLDVPLAYISESGYKLGAWINDQKEKHNAGKLKPERKQRLDDLGMYWGKTRANDWDECFAHLKKYYEANGDIRVPAGYKVDGIWLAKWLNEQKQIYLGKRKGKSLSEEQIAKLESLGSPWKSGAELAWEKRYESVKQYYEEHGDINIPRDTSLSDGKKIGNWFAMQRKYRREGKLTQRQIQLLDALGFVWERDDPWEIGFRHAEEYFKTHGDLAIPIGYVCNDGYRLGSWINNQRSNYLYPNQYHKLTEEQATRLEHIGMIWKPKEERWEASFDLAKAYLAEHGNLLIPQKYKTADGYCLGEWIALQRELKRKGRLEQEKVMRLNIIGMDWFSTAARTWENHYESCAQYYKEHGDLEIPLSYVEEDGFQLGMWLWKIRTGKSKLKTSGENGNQIERLKSISLVVKEDTSLKAVKRSESNIIAIQP